MGIIETFTRRRVLTTVLVLIAVVLGVLAYRGLGVRRFPPMEFPVVTVVTRYSGASPTEVETEITKRIEDTVSTVSGIEKITSSSQQGLSLVMIQFRLKEDVDVKAIDVRNKIDLIRYLLPTDADDPIVQKFEIGSFPIIELALYGERDVNELYRLAEEDLRPMITQVPGVADVSISGGQQREIHVLLDPVRLRDRGVPVGAVAGAIRASNMDVPAGTITQTQREYVVRTPARFKTVQEIAEVRVPSPGGGTLKVGDLGTVVDSYEKPRTKSRFDGKGAVIISILSRTDANEVEVADGIYKLLPKLRERLPQGAAIEVARDTAVYIRGALSNVRQNMLFGLLLTAVTLFLFLKSIRTTIIAVIAIPVSVIVAFVGMQAAGFTLNIISLTGMAMVIGVLVNNAILVLDNAVRFIDRGMLPADAAVAGTQDIALAIMGSTATNLVVFIPIAFMGEIIGRFFKELGLTVVFATVVSLLVSYSLTPMLCGAWLASKEDQQRRPGWVTRLWNATVGRLSDLVRWAEEVSRREYLFVLDWCLKHRALTLLVIVLAVAASVGVLFAIGFEFMPAGDEGRFAVSVEMPLGTPLDVTDSVVRRVEGEVKQVPYLEHYTVKVGSRSGAGARTEGVDMAEVLVTVVDRAKRRESLDDLMSALSARLSSLPDARIAVSRESGGPRAAAVTIEVSGEDMNALQEVSERIKEIVKSTGGTAGVRTSWEAGQPELRVMPNQQELNRFRLTRGQVADEVRSYIEGAQAGQFLDRGQNYDIVVKLDEQHRSSPEDLGRLFISAGAGGMLRIDQVADVAGEPGSAMIRRKDRTRLITVTSDLTGERPISSVLADVRAEIAGSVAIPPGVSVAYSGEAEYIQKNFREIFKAMATASVLTYLCTAGIIESFGLTNIIIASLPVSLVGVALAMLIYRETINMFSLMGLIVFVGMAVNNAIVLVDYAMRREKEVGVLLAIREACDVRYRMILLTNLTNIAALIPLSLGLGFAGEIFRPLAVVQMGGNVAAMILTFFVIPPIYVSLRRRLTR
jgi:HAE1 family hydrophobic/amphiphilic exporter-1